MIQNQKAPLWTLALLVMVSMALPLAAQDEVRLTDGGILEGKIIRETETEVELRHKSFGVIKIPRSKIERMGPYGTLDGPTDGNADTSTGEPSAPSRRPAGSRGTTTSRLDLDYEPERYRPAPIPGAFDDDAQAALEAEMAAKPELASLYDALVNRDVIGEDAALLLFSLNEKWEADPASLSPLENRIVNTLLGKAPEPPAEQQSAYRNPPPVSLAPIVDEVRGKLESVDELSYREHYVLDDGEGRIVVEYERQVSRPDLIAGTGRVIEHVQSAEVGKAVRYFGDGHMLWMLTRRESAPSSEDESPRNPFESSADATVANAPSGTRANFSAWSSAGFPLGQMTRAELLLAPFQIVDLATLELVTEDDEAWVLKARLDSPAFHPMITAELRIARPTGLLESMRLSGDSGSAELKISDAQVAPDLPATTFVVPEAPEGQNFQVVQAPDSPRDALSMLGAL